MSALIVMSSCVVTSEKYRYQTRFDNFYNLLTETEKKQFAENDLMALGDSLDKRLASDEKAKKALAEVKVYEAINTFDGYQTAKFFRGQILKELNKDNYYAMLDFFNEKEQIAFARNSGFKEIAESKYGSDAKFKSFLDNMKKEYRLYLFSNDKLYDFFRMTVWTEMSQKRVFDLFDVLKRGKVLKAYLSDTNASYQDLADRVEKNQKEDLKSGLASVKNLSGLKKLTSANLLDVYKTVVLVEMDREALRKTVEKFIVFGISEE